MYLYFFFFQAEDGIRDYKVTGVQTCALPICGASRRPHAPSPPRRTTTAPLAGARSPALRPLIFPAVKSSWPPVRTARSEERRVGKECRWRWSPAEWIDRG